MKVDLKQYLESNEVKKDFIKFKDERKGASSYVVNPSNKKELIKVFSLPGAKATDENGFWLCFLCGEEIGAREGKLDDKIRYFDLSRPVYSYKKKNKQAATCAFVGTKSYMQNILGRNLDESDKDWYVNHPEVESMGLRQNTGFEVLQTLVRPYNIGISKVYFRKDQLVDERLKRWGIYLGCNPTFFTNEPLSNAEWLATLPEEQRDICAELAKNFNAEFVNANDLNGKPLVVFNGQNGGGHAEYKSPRGNTGFQMAIQYAPINEIQYVEQPPLYEYEEEWEEVLDFENSFVNVPNFGEFRVGDLINLKPNSYSLGNYTHPVYHNSSANNSSDNHKSRRHTSQGNNIWDHYHGYEGSFSHNEPFNSLEIERPVFEVVDDYVEKYNKFFVEDTQAEDSEIHSVLDSFLTDSTYFFEIAESENHANTLERWYKLDTDIIVPNLFDMLEANQHFIYNYKLDKDLIVIPEESAWSDQSEYLAFILSKVQSLEFDSFLDFNSKLELLSLDIKKEGYINPKATSITNSGLELLIEVALNSNRSVIKNMKVPVEINLVLMVINKLFFYNS